MWSLIVSIAGWIIGKFFNKKREKEIEAENARLKKENIEVRSKNAGIEERQKRQEEWLREKEEWENANIDEKQNMLRNRFRKPPD